MKESEFMKLENLQGQFATQDRVHAERHRLPAISFMHRETTVARSQINEA
jgi:hypothetical protein